MQPAWAKMSLANKIGTDLVEFTMNGVQRLVPPLGQREHVIVARGRGLGVAPGEQDQLWGICSLVSNIELL